MTAVAIRAFGLFLIRAPLQPAGDNLLGRNIVAFVAFNAHLVCLISIEYNIRLRRPDIFVVRMAGAYPMAVDTTDLCLEVVFAQLFPDERYMADITARIDAEGIGHIRFARTRLDIRTIT